MALVVFWWLEFFGNTGMGCFLSYLKEKLCLFQQGNLRLNKPQGEVNRNQSFTLLLQKKINLH